MKKIDTTIKSVKYKVLYRGAKTSYVRLNIIAESHYDYKCIRENGKIWYAPKRISRGVIVNTEKEALEAVIKYLGSQQQIALSHINHLQSQIDESLTQEIEYRKKLNSLYHVNS